jgi:splicing factor 3A subunit 3
LGNPAADGYDLASSVWESLEGIRDGTFFSAEEVMGKYLDLQILYETHAVPIKTLLGEALSNNKSEKKLFFGFLDFLTVLSKGEAGLSEGIAETSKLKERKKYARFLLALEQYLQGFLKRTQPLLSIEVDVINPAIQEFSTEWHNKGGCPGWESKPAEIPMIASAVTTDNNDNHNNTSRSVGIDLTLYQTAADLEKAVDGDTLKVELNRLGLKCGGTVSDRAKRLFLTKDTPLNELPKKVFAKKTTSNINICENNANPTGSPASETSNTVPVKNESRMDIARREVIVLALLNQLKPTLEATMRRTERRETQTPTEREKEIDEDLYGSALEGGFKNNNKKKRDGEDGGGSDDDSDEDGPIYNPKGVPLGWDGKPIPYWLFKLHGLNHFYPCEICGNESYRGRRNFETHFAEARHAYGMKSLGIPNSSHFHGVTRIEDALQLWESLKDQLQQNQFDGEEYEDSHGNVLSRATYEDLARQGML